MYEHATEVKRCENRFEEVELAAGRLRVGVGGSEVGIDADEPLSQKLSGLPRLVRLDPPAVHAGVDLQVHLQAGVRHDTLRARDRVRRDLEAISFGESKPIRE